jgi:5'-nucleotidase
MEALVQGIPAMAFSIGRKGDLAAAEQWVRDMIRDLQTRPIAANEIWNVNFPPCSAEELRGVLYDRIPGNQMGYHDKVYEATPVDAQSWELEQRLIWKMDHVPGTDLAAVRENYISVGKLRNMVLQG